MKKSLLLVFGLVVVVGIAACGFEPDTTGTPDPDSGDFALTNTTARANGGLLRGQGLKVYTTVPSRYLDPDTFYEVNVTNDNTLQLLSTGDVRTNEYSEISPYDLLFDVGQYGRVEEEDNIRVTLTGDMGEEFSQVISLGPIHVPGWDVSEVEPPEAFACDAAGNPTNAFAVGGQDPGEVVGPVYICANTVPEGYRGTTADVYIVEPRDNWMGTAIPQEGEEGHILGPIAASVNAAGEIAPTEIFVPGLEDVGIYDILLDVDSDGMMEWDLGMKDGGDGVGEQVGFTVQYSQAWIRARGQRHIFVNVGYNSSGRGDGVWANEYRVGETIYGYLNPPVMHQYHFGVRKWIVPHQDFEAFWNNPALETGPGGCIPFAALTGGAAGGTGPDGEGTGGNFRAPVQDGCTNTGPVAWGPAPDTGDATATAWDMVYDRNQDGCYMAGEDLLDIIGGAHTGGGLVTFEEFQAMDPEDQVGLRVVR